MFCLFVNEQGIFDGLLTTFLADRRKFIDNLFLHFFIYEISGRNPLNSSMHIPLIFMKLVAEIH